MGLFFARSPVRSGWALFFQPIENSKVYLLRNRLSKGRTKDLFFVFRVAEKGHFTKCIRIIGRTAEGKIEAAYVAVFFEAEGQHPVQDRHAQRAKTDITVIGAGALY